MQPRAEIFVPTLVIVPQVWLGADVEYRTDNNLALTAADYQQFKPPTLAELRHAFFDRNPDGTFVSPEYRQSVLSNRGRGEWTSTFLRDGTEAIERPERVFYDRKSGLWIAEGGSVSKVKLPYNGWAVEYDTSTGFPSRTSKNRRDAEEKFGDDASYFSSDRNGLRAVLRGFSPDDGPFLVSAVRPGYWYSYVGSRSCRRSD